MQIPRKGSQKKRRMVTEIASPHRPSNWTVKRSWMWNFIVDWLMICSQLDYCFWQHHFHGGLQVSSLWRQTSCLSGCFHCTSTTWNSMSLWLTNLLLVMQAEDNYVEGMLITTLDTVLHWKPPFEQLNMDWTQPLLGHPPAQHMRIEDTTILHSTFYSTHHTRILHSASAWCVCTYFCQISMTLFIFASFVRLSVCVARR